MKFCIECGSDVIHFSIPTGDNRKRFHCQACGNIHYQNPKVICGSLPFYDNAVLLCKRAIEPRKGLWTLPAGFMENNETTLEAAQRETFEEAMGALIEPELYTIFNLPDISQIYFFYRGDLKEGRYGIGEESLEVELFSEEAIPWDQLAFPTITQSLKLFFADRKKACYPIRVIDLYKPLPKK